MLASDFNNSKRKKGPLYMRLKNVTYNCDGKHKSAFVITFRKDV